MYTTKHLYSFETGIRETIAFVCFMNCMELKSIGNKFLENALNQIKSVALTHVCLENDEQFTLTKSGSKSPIKMQTKRNT